jgi:hypothetical protein
LVGRQYFQPSWRLQRRQQRHNTDTQCFVDIYSCFGAHRDSFGYDHGTNDDRSGFDDRTLDSDKCAGDSDHRPTNDSDDQPDKLNNDTAGFQWIVAKLASGKDLR